MKGGQRLGAGRIPDANARRHVLQVRVSEEELESVKATAKHYSLSVSDLVRKALGLAVASLLVAGCALGAPVRRDLEETLAEATPIIVAEWEAVLGVDLPDAAPVVVWHSDCVPFEGECYGALYRAGDDEIDLLVPPSHRVSDTALAHELLHWALLRTYGFGDHTHERHEWTRVDEINHVLWCNDL